MDLKYLQSLVQNLSGVSAWELRSFRKKSHQRYLIFDQIETQRIVETEKFEVCLYKELKKNGETGLGESTVSLSEGDNVQKKLTLGLEMAALVSNPVFSLPEKGSIYDPVQILDPDVKEKPLSYLDRIQEDLGNLSFPKIRRSSTEIFVEDRGLSLVNSNGLELKAESTNLFVDFVLLAESGAHSEGECQGFKQTRFYKDLSLNEMGEKYAQYAQESLEARLPKGGSYPVIFSEEALDTLFNYFCLQSSGPARFQNWSHFEIGKPVISALRGEPLTLFSNPGLPGGLKTRSFDDNGFPLRPVKVIDGNLFMKRMNNKRYADYLQEEATGDFSNLEIGTGTRSTEELLTEGPCYHLLRFSTFEPNPVTGAFSGEVRTGYFLKKGQKKPIKGGSVSGRVQEAFQSVYFSREKTQREAYLGPQAVRIEILDIAGD